MVLEYSSGPPAEAAVESPPIPGYVVLPDFKYSWHGLEYLEKGVI